MTHRQGLNLSFRSEPQNNNIETEPHGSLGLSWTSDPQRVGPRPTWWLKVRNQPKTIRKCYDDSLKVKKRICEFKSQPLIFFTIMQQLK